MEELLVRISDWDKCNEFVSEYLQAFPMDDWEKVYADVREKCHMGKKYMIECMPVMIIGEKKCQMLTRLLEDAELGNVIMECIVNLLRAMQLDTRISKEIPEYNSEVRALKQFKENESKYQFRNLYHFVDMTERGREICGNSPIEIIKKKSVPKMSTDNLLEILNNKKLMGIIWIIDSTTYAQKTNLLCATEATQYIRFECLRQLVYFQKDTEAVESFLQLIGMGISKIAIDAEVWGEVLAFYMEFPTRAPLFFAALGNVLGTLSGTALRQVAESIVLKDNDRSEEMKIISDCFSRATECTISDSVKRMMKSVYERWLQFVDGKHDYLLDIVKTRAWGIVTLYVRNTFSDDERMKFVEEETMELDNLNQKWFASEADMKIEYYRHLTKLKVFI